SRSPARTAAEKGPTDGAIRSVVIISRRMSSISCQGPWAKAADRQSTPMSWNVNSLVSVLSYCASGAVGYDHERRSAPCEFNPLRGAEHAEGWPAHEKSDRCCR